MKILLIDDHPLFRKGFAVALSDIPDIKQILEASTAQEAFSLLAAEPAIDYIFLDLKLPDINGIVFLQELRQQKLTTPVVILSATDDIETVENCLQAGASGYLSKASAGEEIAEAIHSLEKSGYFLAENLRLPLTHYREESSQDSAITLTSRQQQILQLLAEGNSNQAIAAKLELAVSTVKGHVSSLYDILDCKNRTQCAVVAHQKRLTRKT